MSAGPLKSYRAKLANQEIKHDPAQELAVEKLQSLHFKLEGYRPTTGRSGLMARLGFGKRGTDTDPPQGLYIFGDVGRGKSMLMDLFFDGVQVERKRRVHFHAFMQEIQERLHAWRKDNKGSDANDPMPKIAQAVAEETWLLCFDEFHVTNIADAMILGRLFEALFKEGVVIVSTSNWAPGDLYKNGLQRDRFLPFIALIKEKLDILELSSETDYRLIRMKGMPVYYTPLNAHTDEALKAAFQRLEGGSQGHPDSLSVKGRTISVSRAGNGVAWFTYEELCQQPLGPGDYLAIAKRYHTIVLAGIPQLSPTKRDEAKRLMTLIDALYEHRTKLVASAEAAPSSLYPQGKEAFEFMRTVSRMTEMQSQDYIEGDHLGDWAR